MPQKYLILWACLALSLLSTCKDEGRGNRFEADVQNVNLDLDIQRIDSLMYKTPVEKLPDVFGQLRNSDSLIFELYLGRVLGLPLNRPQVWHRGIKKWASNASMNTLYEDVDSAYHDLAPLEHELEAAFARHLYFFPQDTVPDFYSILTATYQVVTYPQTVAISLDMFLGKDYRFYPSMQYPDYKIVRFQREYILPSVMKAWFGQRFPEERYTDSKLLSKMIHEGKMLVYAQTMLPNVADTLLIEYSGKQYRWCEDNEAKIWTHLVEQDVLYNSDPQTVEKYMSDGPFTVASGIPQQSAPRLGAYIGWKIVRAYLDQHPDVSLDVFLHNKDYKSILNNSQYQPSSKPLS